MTAKSERRAAPPRGGLWQRLRTFVSLWVDLFARHNLLTYASAIALQAFVAGVALLLLLLGVLGAIGRTDVWNEQIGPQVSTRVILPVFSGIDQTIQHIFQSDSTGLIAFAAVFAVWEVSGAVRATMGALNEVYEVEEHRPFWIRFPVSFGLAIVLIVGVLGAILVVTVGRKLGSGALTIPVGIGRWALAVALIGSAFGLLLRLAPAERRASRWATGGALLLVAAWIVETLIFRWYLTSVADFKTPIGGLVVVLVFTTYLYVAAIILLVAIELDELIRRGVDEEAGGLLRFVRGLF